MLRFIASLVLVGLLAACETESPAPVLDAGLGVVADAGDPPEEDAGFSSACEDACQNTTLTVRIGSKNAPIDRVQFGFTSPERSPRERWEVYLEAHAGGDPACPTQNAPTPDRTIVFGGVTIPTDATEQTKGDGLTLVLLDFKEVLTEEPLVRAETISLTPVAANLCPECVLDGGSADEQFLAFELSAEFADGGVQGHGYARYCESMNDL